MKLIAMEKRIANDLRHQGKKGGFVCVSKNGDPEDRIATRLCSAITKRLINGQSVEYYRDLLKEFKEFSVEESKERLEELYK